MDTILKGQKIKYENIPLDFTEKNENLSFCEKMMNFEDFVNPHPKIQLSKNHYKWILNY